MPKVRSKSFLDLSGVSLIWRQMHRRGEYRPPMKHVDLEAKLPRVFLREFFRHENLVRLGIHGGGSISNAQRRSCHCFYNFRPMLSPDPCF